MITRNTPVYIMEHAAAKHPLPPSTRNAPFGRQSNKPKTGLSVDDFIGITQVSRLSTSDITECTKVEKRDLRPDDFIIAVMGPTGAGKSTFISSAIGRDAGIGENLQSFTSQITAIRISFNNGINVVLVDSPGFDDTFLSDLDILKLISDWLRPRRGVRLQLAGMIYLHRISDNRMGGTPLKNLKLFQKLCGKDRYDKVILTTTMWSEVEREEGYSREKELRDDYWASMIKMGSVVCRFENTSESAWRIIHQFLSSSKRLIQIQRELRADWKEVPDTSAGRELYGIAGALARRQQELLHQLQSEVVRTRDEESMRALLQEFTELGRRRETVIREMKDLKTSFVRRLYRRLRRKQASFPYHDRCEALIMGLSQRGDLQARVARINDNDAELMSAFISELFRNKRISAAEEVQLLTILSLLVEKAGRYPSCFNAPKSETKGEKMNRFFTPAKSLAVKETFPSICSLHQNILPFYTAPFNDNWTEVAVPQRMNLYDYLTSKKLKQQDRIGLISDIANGLAYLHSLGIVHGNLRTENVFVSDSDRASISASSHVVHKDMTPFLPRWTAPELRSRLSRKTAESDVWAFGCLCLEILTADLPYYENRSWRLISYLRVGLSPPRPPTIDDEMWDLITRCWELDPRQRPDGESILQVFHPRVTGEGDIGSTSMNTFRMNLREPSTSEIDYQKVYQIILSLLRIDSRTRPLHETRGGVT
ncbi:hypothetical protein D9756_003431 [Leucocoprinus leucothites]|uniref:Protein kinase domain-containing protein n=1 Tax=Leucocoprinus leucothites TaxID=201217 RepID=A0A8H5G6B7_9AGAR|nr:hypothetical protein D9756_003431 [Leucoagaricus leucothites]